MIYSVGMIASNVTIVCQKTQFSSILISCWWAVITVTTVGKFSLLILTCTLLFNYFVSENLYRLGSNPVLLL